MTETYIINKDISNMTFRNYKELCNYLGWIPTKGKGRIFQMQAIEQLYNITKQGHLISIGAKVTPKSLLYINNRLADFWVLIFSEGEKFLDEDSKMTLKSLIYNIDNKLADFWVLSPESNSIKTEELQDNEIIQLVKDINNTIKLLESNDRNNKYISNNIKLLINQMKENNNIYVTCNSKQMADFGFIRRGFTPDYSNSSMTIGRDPQFKTLPDVLIEQLIELVGNNYSSLVYEVYAFIADRYKRLMRTTYSKILGVKIKDDIGVMTEGELYNILRKIRNTANIAYVQEYLIGIRSDKSESRLTEQEIQTYSSITTKIFDIFKLPEGNKSHYDRAKIGQAYAQINYFCKSKLGYVGFKKELIFTPSKNLDFFNITPEQAEEARIDNNNKMRATAINYFTKKYNKFENKLKALELIIDYAMQL